MNLLIVSLFALLLGPLLYGLARTRSAFMSGLDGFLVVTIGGLVLADIVPAAYQLAGWWALGFALGGFLAPGLVEISSEPAARPAHRIAIILALLSLCLHGLLDGVALAVGEATQERALPLAIILHRVPVALTIWWLLLPRFGGPIASSVLGIVALSTIGGFSAGAWVASTLYGFSLGCFQALVAGSLFHVVVHRSEFVKHQDELVEGAPSRWPVLLLGGAAGAAVLLVAWLG